MNRSRVLWGLFVLILIMCLCFGVGYATDNIPEETTVLVLDGWINADFTEQESVWFRFVPEETDIYVFYSSSDGKDPTVMLYEKTGDTISYIATDFDSGTGWDFQIRSKLTAGVEYYYCVTLYDTASFPVMLEKYTGLFTEYKDNQSWYSGINYGETVILGVEASSGSGDITYRWAEKEDGGLWTWMEGKTDPLISVTAKIRNYYRCQVSDGVTTEVLDFSVFGTDAVEAEAVGNPSFLIAPGGSATMEVSATSNSGMLTYSWYKLSKLADGSQLEEKIEGADTATYTAENITENCIYRCEISGLSDSTDINFTVDLNVPIIVQPVAGNERTVEFGESAEMEVAASSDYGSLYYQWYIYDQNDTPIAVSGATEASCTLNNICTQTACSCRVWNQYGFDAYVFFNIFVQGDFVAYAESSSISIDPGESCTLHIHTSPEDEPLTYQWFYPVSDRRDTPEMIPGQTESSLLLENASAAGYYLCKIRNTAGIEKGIWIYVEIISELTADPAYDEVFGYSDEEIIISADAYSSAGEVTYQWYIEDDEYPGVEYARKIEGATDSSYVISSPEKPHIYYYCVISDIYGNTRTVTRFVRINDHIDIEETSETWQYVSAGDPVTFSLNASGTGNLSYHWEYSLSEQWEDFQTIDGANAASYTIENAWHNMCLRCYVSSSFDASTYMDFYLRVENNLYMDYIYPAYVSLNEPATLTARAFYLSGTISCQWYEISSDIFNEEAEILIPGATETSYTTEPVTGNKKFRCRVMDEYGNSTYTDAEVYIDNKLNAYSAGPETLLVSPGETVSLQVSASAETGELRYEWFMVDRYSYEAIPGATENTYTTDPILQKQEFCCKVYDIFGNCESVYFHIAVDNQLTVQAACPMKIQVKPAETVVLSVVASVKEGSVHYKWYHNGLIRDAVGPTITTAPINSTTGYECEVSDDYGNTESIYFNIAIDNNLQVCAVGPTDFLVQPGESVSLEVSASASVGEIHYQWGEDIGGSLPAIHGATDPVYTTGPINKTRRFLCRVWDDYGNETGFSFFTVRIDSGLTGEAAGPSVVTVDPGETVTFAVTASVNLGQLSYQWYANYGSGYSTISGAVGNTVTTEPINRYSRFYCRIADEYLNYKYIYFTADLKNGQAVQTDGPNFSLSDGSPTGDWEYVQYTTNNSWTDGKTVIVHSLYRVKLTNNAYRYFLSYTAPEGYQMAVMENDSGEFNFYADGYTTGNQSSVQFDIENIYADKRITISFFTTQGMFFIDFRHQVLPVHFSLTYGTPYGLVNQVKYTIGENLDDHPSAEIHSYTWRNLDNGYIRFSLVYTMPEGLHIAVFDPPNGDTVRLNSNETTTEGKNLLRFDVDAGILPSIGGITVNFYNDNESYWIFFSSQSMFSDHSSNIVFNQTEGVPNCDPENLGFVFSKNNVPSSMTGQIHSCTSQKLDNGYTRITLQYTMPEGLWLSAQQYPNELFSDPSITTSSEKSTLQFDIEEEDFSVIQLIFHHNEYGMAYIVRIFSHSTIPDPSQATIALNPTNGNPVSEEENVYFLQRPVTSTPPLNGGIDRFKKQRLNNGYTRFVFRFTAPEGSYIRVYSPLFEYNTANNGTSGANNTVQVDIRDEDLENVSTVFVNFYHDNLYSIYAEIPIHEGSDRFDLSEMSVLYLPDTLEVIEEEAFVNLSCEAVVIPNHCTFIGSHAFYDCRHLRYVRVPASARIAYDAFEGSNVWIEIVQEE